MKEHFVLTAVDKLTHNVGITCKVWYRAKLYQELTSNAYAATHETFQEIIERHKHFNDKYEYRKYDKTLPHLYGILKAHKRKLRYIAGVSATHPIRSINTVDGIYERPRHIPTCSTTSASKFLCRQLQTVIKVLQEHDKEVFRGSGTRRCFIVRRAEDVFQHIKVFREYVRYKRPRTFDFTTMYTKLPQQRIINNAVWAVNKAIEFYNSHPGKYKYMVLLCYALTPCSLHTTNKLYLLL